MFSVCSWHWWQRTPCRCPSPSRLIQTNLTHQTYSYLPSFPPWPMQTSPKKEQGQVSCSSFTRTPSPSLPAKPSQSCKQHAKIACCALASFRPLFLHLLLGFFHEGKKPTVAEPPWHFAIIQKAICRTCRGAEGLRKVELADTLWTVLLAMSCNCKVFFNIYLFLYITFCKISDVR